MWGSSSVVVASIFFRQHDRQHTVDERVSVCVLEIWLGLDDPGDGLGPKGGDASGHDRMAGGQVVAQLVIKRANAVGGHIHGSPRSEKSWGNARAAENGPSLRALVQVLTGVGFSSATDPACRVTFG